MQAAKAASLQNLGSAPNLMRLVAAAAVALIGEQRIERGLNPVGAPFLRPHFLSIAVCGVCRPSIRRATLRLALAGVSVKRLLQLVQTGKLEREGATNTARASSSEQQIASVS